MGEKDSAEALEGEIAAQAEERSGALVDRAERIARRISRQAERRAGEIRTEAEKAARPRREAETVRRMSLVDLEVRREGAARRERLVRQVLDEARARLKGWRERPDAKEILARLVIEAVEILAPHIGEAAEVQGGGKLSVEFADMKPNGDARGGWGEPALAKLAGEISKRLGRTVELELVRAEDPPSSGARVTSADGRSRVDQTTGARLARFEGDLRRLIHTDLFTRREDRERKR